MIGEHAMKVKVFHPDYNEHREVLTKTVKDGRAAITRGSPRVMRALLMSLEATSVFPQRGRDDAAHRRYVFPSDVKPRLSNQ